MKKLVCVFLASLVIVPIALFMVMVVFLWPMHFFPAYPLLQYAWMFTLFAVLVTLGVWLEDK